MLVLLTDAAQPRYMCMLFAEQVRWSPPSGKVRCGGAQRWPFLPFLQLTPWPRHSPGMRLSLSQAVFSPSCVPTSSSLCLHFVSSFPFPF